MDGQKRRRRVFCKFCGKYVTGVDFLLDQMGKEQLGELKETLKKNIKNEERIEDETLGCTISKTDDTLVIKDDRLEKMITNYGIRKVVEEEAKNFDSAKSGRFAIHINDKNELESNLLGKFFRMISPENDRGWNTTEPACIDGMCLEYSKQCLPFTLLACHDCHMRLEVSNVQSERNGDITQYYSDEENYKKSINIMLVGMRSSGKTVLLLSLLKNLQVAGDNMFYNINDQLIAFYYNEIKENLYALSTNPEATSSVQPPLTLEIRDYRITFIDTMGENFAGAGKPNPTIPRYALLQTSSEAESASGEYTEQIAFTTGQGEKNLNVNFDSSGKISKESFQELNNIFEEIFPDSKNVTDGDKSQDNYNLDPHQVLNYCDALIVIYPLQVKDIPEDKSHYALLLRETIHQINQTIKYINQDLSGIVVNGNIRKPIILLFNKCDIYREIAKIIMLKEDSEQTADQNSQLQFLRKIVFEDNMEELIEKFCGYLTKCADMKSRMELCEKSKALYKSCEKLSRNGVYVQCISPIGNNKRKINPKTLKDDSMFVQDFLYILNELCKDIKHEQDI